VIRSFKHRGLKRLYERDDRSGVRPDLVSTVEDILARLDEADTPQALNLPGYRLHLLKGDLRGFGRLPCVPTGALFFAFRVRTCLT
jgi:proteic killer suppression protein